MAEAEITILVKRTVRTYESDGTCAVECDEYHSCRQIKFSHIGGIPGGDCPLAKEVDRGDD